ncbi:MAG: hypothetical protein ACHBN1_22805 [Heteroscytonema crispum UTEX LB 1556]
MATAIAVLTCVKYIGISGTIHELSLLRSDCVLHPTQKRYIRGGASFFLTNDARLPSLPDLSVLVLNQIIA